MEGVCLGDSGIFLGNMESGVRRVVPPNTFYTAPWDPGSHGIPPSAFFRVPVKSGDWVVTCSDGVHECRYETPEESIGMEELESLMIGAGRSPEALVEAAVRLALAGVRGHPAARTTSRSSPPSHDPCSTRKEVAEPWSPPGFPCPGSPSPAPDHPVLDPEGVIRLSASVLPWGPDRVPA